MLFYLCGGLMFNHIIQELITKAIEKQAEKIITKKTSKQIQKDANTFNKPHLFVSGYYQAYAFLLVLPILIIVLLLCIFIQFQIHHFDMVALCCILMIFLLYATYKRVHKMYLLAYWQAGLTFYDRKGNQLVQIPSSYLKNATSKTNKLIIPYHNETWIIEKNKNDNLKEVEKMLSYFKNDSFCYECQNLYQ